MTESASLYLQVLTPDGLIFKRAELTAINVPLVDGANIGIRPNHAPLIAETALGKIKFRSTDNENAIFLHPGILAIRDNTVTLFTAGEVADKPSEKIIELHITEYERLMNTIVDKLIP